MFRNIRLEIEDRIALLTFNRPEVLNALNRETLQELQAALAQLKHDDAVGAVILTGAGEKAFVAGADIKELARIETALQAREGSLRGQAIFDEIENFPKPVIAAVNGFALGGGCEMAMACHLRIAAEEAQFGQPEVKLGIIPGYGGTQRLTRLVGKGLAMELVLSGQLISAAEALRIGLVNKVVKRNELLAVCRQLTSAILANGPLALRYSIEAINRGAEMPLPQAQALEATLFGLSCASEDRKEGTQAFMKKRKPVFRGR